MCRLCLGLSFKFVTKKFFFLNRKWPELTDYPLTFDLLTDITSTILINIFKKLLYYFNIQI